jgi:hypothetical protein
LDYEKGVLLRSIFKIFKTMNTIVEDIKRKGVSIPCNFTDEEFREEIRKAEMGPFISIDELEHRLEIWKMELNSKK